MDSIGGPSVGNQARTDAPEPNAFVLGEVFAGVPQSQSLRKHLERCLNLSEHAPGDVWTERRVNVVLRGSYRTWCP